MSRETLDYLTVNLDKDSFIARKIRNTLAERFERVAIVNKDFVSFILVGGLGFGDFNQQLSDIDTWLIMRDVSPADRLLKSRDLYSKYLTIKDKMIQDRFLQVHNFRHPPTFLTESESVGYRKAFSAKVGLPMSLGIFPAIIGLSRENEVCFTDDQLKCTPLSRHQNGQVKMDCSPPFFVFCWT